MAASSILAVIHDIIVSVGVYAIFQFEVSPATVTAFLTILGFSLYDTVVVFDKIGENQKTLTATGRIDVPRDGEPLAERGVDAVAVDDDRRVAAGALPARRGLAGSWARPSLESFALALAVGLGIGAYSSIFVAAPILAAWKAREPQYRALEDRRRRSSLAAASVSTGVPVIEDNGEPQPVAVPEGVAGPPAVGRTVAPRPRQQRGRKRTLTRRAPETRRGAPVR